MKKMNYPAILVLMLIFMAIISQGQSLVAVQNGGTPRFYSILEEAINNAQNKDTIYIPGGAYSFKDSWITIDKELHLIGCGHHPDSAKVLPTVLNAHIKLISGASNSSFEGFLLNGDFVVPSDDEDVDNITIQRCSFSSIRLSRLSEYWLVSENVVIGAVIGGYNSPYAKNNVFTNNFIGSTIYYFGQNNTFKNNYINCNGCNFNLIDGCYFTNNIFDLNHSEPFIYQVIASVFENNIFFWSNYIPASCINKNNIFSQSSSTTFNNNNLKYFDYKEDYHLKPDSPGKNAGTDGTDIGLYGGAYPWKEGAIPSNPHYQRVQISPKTDNSGKLNVKVKVAAQDN